MPGSNAGSERKIEVKKDHAHDDEENEIEDERNDQP